MGFFIMVQLREESRQCLWQAGGLADQVKGIKLLGYHYIQQNQRRLLNRLTYLLLQGLVELCANNQLLYSQIQRGQIVEEYIELLMQEKVEGRGASSFHSDNRQKQIYKKEAEDCQKKVEELLGRNAALEDSLRLVEDKFAKQTKVLAKIKQKYSAISELMFQVKQNHEREVQRLLELHAQEAKALKSQSTFLNQELIKAKTRLQILQAQKGVLSYQAKEENVCTTSFCQTEMTAGYSNDVRMAICTIDSFSYAPKETKLLIEKKGSYKIESNSKQTSYEHILDVTIMPFSIARYSQQSQTIQSKPELTDSNIQTQLKTLDLITQQEKQSQIQQQISTLSVIFDRAQKQSQSARLKFATRDEEYIKLAQHYNNLQESHENLRQGWLKEKDQAQSTILSLKGDLQRLSLLNQHLERSLLQYCSNIQLPQLKPQKQQPLPSSCDQTSQSTTPRKRQDSLPLSHISEFIQPTIDQAYIRKDTISKYLFQLLDKNCKGEEISIIIQQISSCLDWQQEQTEKIKQYGRKTRLKEASQGPDEGLQTRFYRFLTEQ